MVNKNKRLGDDAERAVRDYLQLRGVHAERVPAGNTADIADIWIPHISWPAIQVKNHSRLDLAGWVDDVEIQAANAKRASGVVVHKRRGKGNPANWYTTMSLKTFVDLMGVDHV
jgi:Holliday junction resolvase